MARAWSASHGRRCHAGASLRLGFHLEAGMKVGLYGGSFDPPHEGHAHVARAALRRLALDRVIWLVSPQNPLKSQRASAPLHSRLAMSQLFAIGPSMMASAAESRLGSRFTVDTVLRFRARFPKVHFVWIMGADSLAAFHTWRNWRTIMAAVPIAIVSRPGHALKSLFSPATKVFSRGRLPASAARRLSLTPPPAWIYFSEPLKFASSTTLRNRR
ncbi:MAG TPA: nicotinate-nucleotide adenylyltransferase [Caulobacteraceae bacterium]